jgi:hypothetical protein
MQATLDKYRRGFQFIEVAPSGERPLRAPLQTRRESLVTVASWLWRFLIDGFASYACALYPGLIVDAIAHDNHGDPSPSPNQRIAAPPAPLDRFDVAATDRSAPAIRRSHRVWD